MAAGADDDQVGRVEAGRPGDALGRVAFEDVGLGHDADPLRLFFGAVEDLAGPLELGGQVPLVVRISEQGRVVARP